MEENSPYQEEAIKQHYQDPPELIRQISSSQMIHKF